MSLKIHITLILILIYNYFFSDIKLFIMFYMFVVMHELSHAIVALLLKVDIKELEFTPFGVCAKYENNISDLKELIISASGPLFSIFLHCSIFNIKRLVLYPLCGGYTAFSSFHRFLP